MPKVSDPALLAKLNGGEASAPKKVTDPALLAKLNGADDAAPDTSGIAPQALSGANEGLANFLSLPNNVVRATEMGLRSIGPTIGNALGGHFDMPSEPMLKLPDAGEAYRGIANSMNAIKPTTDNPAGKFARRVGEEVGANIIPSLGVESKVASVLASLGGGMGAATAQAAFPGNAAAEYAGEMIGGFTPVGVANNAERNAIKAAAPSVDELKADASALYKAAEARGVTFARPAVKQLADEVAADAISQGIDPALHPRATAALQRIQSAGNTGMTVSDAQTLRRVVAGAGKDFTNPDEQRLAGRMVAKLDDFVSGAAPELAEARQVYHQAKKGEMIEQAIELAGSRAGQFSGSGFENALRTEFRGLDRKIIKGQLKGLSDEEIEAVRKVANGDAVSNVLRFIGKAAPTGIVSFSGSAGVPFMIGNAIGGPGAGAAAAATTMGTGLVARQMATRMTSRNAQTAAALMRRGGAGKAPLFAPKSSAVARALLAAQAANQNSPREALIQASSR